MPIKVEANLCASALIFSLLPKNSTKNIVEKCGKVLTYSHFLYFCPVFGMKYAIITRAETFI